MTRQAGKKRESLSLFLSLSSHPGPITRKMLIEKAGQKYREYSVQQWIDLYLDVTHNTNKELDDASDKCFQTYFSSFRKTLIYKSKKYLNKLPRLYKDSWVSENIPLKPTFQVFQEKNHGKS